MSPYKQSPVRYVFQQANPIPSHDVHVHAQPLSSVHVLYFMPVLCFDLG